MEDKEKKEMLIKYKNLRNEIEKVIRGHKEERNDLKGKLWVVNEIIDDLK